MQSVTIASPIGPLRLTATGGQLTKVSFVGRWSPTDPAIPVENATASNEPALNQAGRQLGEYFSGTRTGFDLPLTLAGDTFQRRVWEQIAEIPYGTTVPYGTIARNLGGVGLSQAVGSAAERNPLVLLIPCHRVVGSNGSLTGFGGGLDRKRFLLSLEESEQVRNSRLF